MAKHPTTNCKTINEFWGREMAKRVPQTHDGIAPLRETSNDTIQWVKCGSRNFSVGIYVECKKLNSLKHPVRTTVAGSHN